MCLICIDLQSKKLTPFEALSNYGEIIDTIDEDHAPELLNLISSALMSERDQKKDNSSNNEEETDWKYGSD